MKPRIGTFSALLSSDQLAELAELKQTLSDQRHSSPAKPPPDANIRRQPLSKTSSFTRKPATKATPPVKPCPKPEKMQGSKSAKKVSLKKARQQVAQSPKKRMSRVDKAIALAGVKPSRPKQQQPDLLVKVSFEKHSVNMVDGKHGKLMLHVKRGNILKTAGHCSVCFTSAAPLTRYADSNYGPVMLCSVCKVSAFETSFGHADAMPLKMDHAHAHKGKW